MKLTNCIRCGIHDGGVVVVVGGGGAIMGSLRHAVLRITLEWPFPRVCNLGTGARVRASCSVSGHSQLYTRILQIHTRVYVVVVGQIRVQGINNNAAAVWVVDYASAHLLK